MKQSLGIFTSGLARIFGLHGPTLTVYARSLRQAGLIPTGGRGNSAAAMTPREAAVILLALLVTERPALAVEAVQEFGAFLYNRLGGGVSPSPLHGFLGLPETTPFLDVFAAIIGAYTNEDKLDALGDGGGAFWRGAATQMKIACHLKWMSVVIEFSGRSYVFAPARPAAATRAAALARFEKEFGKPDQSGCTADSAAEIGEALIGADETDEFFSKLKKFGKGLDTTRAIGAPELVRIGRFFMDAEESAPPRREKESA